MGSRILLERQLTETICDELALRWEDIVITQGLPIQEKEAIFKKYTPPSNCLFIDSPTLNPDVKDALHPNVHKRDERIVDKQKKITTGLSITALVMNRVLKQKDVDLTMVELLSDIGSIYADLPNDENNIQKLYVESQSNFQRSPEGSNARSVFIWKRSWWTSKVMRVDWKIQQKMETTLKSS